MNKLERMTAILLFLQERPRTAREIAEHFEVSRRTILRDVQALSEMGVPVIAREGSAGGYALPDDYSLAPLALDTREAFLLLLALESLRRPADVPFGRERASLEAKLRALLPAQHREDAERILSGVSIGPANPASTHQRSHHLDALVTALENGRWLDGLYHSARRSAVQRLFPIGIHLDNGFWYLRAYSPEYGEERTYRVDRFQTLTLLDPSPPAPTLNPSRSYAASTDPLAQVRLTRKGAAQVDSDPHLGPLLNRLPDGSAELEFRFPLSELEWFARFFAALGDDAQVDSPPELRTRLAELGSSLFRRYSER